MTQIAKTGAFGQVISTLAEASPQTACFINKGVGGEAVSHHFEQRLLELGYSKQSENDQPPNVYSSKWATPEGVVLSFIWLSPSPSEVLTFAFYNGGSMAEEQARGAVADALGILMEEAKNRPDALTYLAQESRFPLPSGSLELPADKCEPGLARATFVEFPLLSCYAVPLEPAQLLAALTSKLTPLGYEQSYLAEEPSFTAINWVSPKPGAPKLGIIIASATQIGGSILHEVDTEEALRQMQ